MSIFDCIFGRSTATVRRGGMSAEYRAALREMRKQRSKLYRVVRNAVIIAAVMITTFFILAFVFEELRKPGVFKFVFVVYALCAGGGMTLPWIIQFERDRKRQKNGESVAAWHKYVFFGALGLIAVCTLLWVISVFVIGDDILLAISDGKNNEQFASSFTMLRLSIIVTLQVAIATVIATNAMRYGKKYLALRIIMYVALAYLDFYISWIVATITTAVFNGVPFAPLEVTFIVPAIMMAVALGVAGGLFRSHAQRKEVELFMKGDMKALTEGDVDLIDAETNATGWGRPETASTAPTPPAADPEKQLLKIKELLDKGIITEEEYQAKRKDIIDKM